jgi:hypothetical protein
MRLSHIICVAVACATATGSPRAATTSTASSNASGKTCQERDFRPIRGYCADDYLQFDVLWDAVQDAQGEAFLRYFPLQMEVVEDLPPAVQIRHREDPSRSRWRGEFMISVTVSPNAVSAKFWRAKAPLQVQLHQLVHERLYAGIAEAFAKSALAADSPEWAGVVRGMVPAKADLVNAVQIERFVTTNATCPALDTQLSKARQLTVRASLPYTAANPPLKMYLHSEVYDVVLDGYPRLVHVRGADHDDPFFAWAEETVHALQECWRPA